jgi:hypothetical protein
VTKKVVGVFVVRFSCTASYCLEGVPDLVNGITLNEALQSVEWIESLSEDEK